MVKIHSTLIKKLKKLRSLTGSGFLDCKKALLATDNNIEKAIDFLRENNKYNLYNKCNNITKNGVILTGIDNNFAAIVEINSETDFVAKNSLFLNFAKEVITVVLKEKFTKICELKYHFNDKRVSLISKVDENINIGRLGVLHGGDNITIGSYVHNMHLGALVSLSKVDQNFAKGIAMHIVAYQPQYINIDNIPNRLLDRERSVQLKIANKMCKSNEILKNYIDGKINKFIKNIVLVEQNYLFSSKRVIKDILLEKKSQVIDFLCFRVGE